MKVRLKVTETVKRRCGQRSWTRSAFLALVCVLGLVGSVRAAGNGMNRPPKFLLEGQSEIVLRLKEGAETPVGE